jgi:hypothetical protein
MSPKGAFFLSLAAFVAIIIAVGLIWALVGSGTALILGLAMFAVFYGTLIWLYRETTHESHSSSACAPAQCPRSSRAARRAKVLGVSRAPRRSPGGRDRSDRFELFRANRSAAHNARGPCAPDPRTAGRTA